MIVPLTTDAPLYHKPWGTAGLILVNLLALLLTPGDAYDDWILAYGDGLHPLQWISSNFLHAGWLHLIGNMLFLWVFGLVVEGKLGWWRFLPLYLGIGVASCLIEQTVMLGVDHGGSLGASGVIFGLIAIALVWAPENRISVFFLGNMKTYDWPIWGFAALDIACEFISAALDSFKISTPMLHLIGAGCGLGAGVLLLKRGWVDCEGWDWFSRRRRGAIALDGGRRTAPPAPVPVAHAAAETDRTALREELAASIGELLQAGQLGAAWSAYLGESGAPGAWLLPRPVHESLVRALLGAKKVAEARPLLRAAVAAWPGATALRLAWAQVLLADKRPAQVLEAIEGIEEAGLGSGQRALRDQIAAKARALQDEGVLEIAD